MKTLIVFYSRTGSCEKIAKDLAKSLKCEVLMLNPKKNYKGLIGILKAGIDAQKKKSINLYSYDTDPKEYDSVIICSPIWAGSLTPVIRSFLKNNSFKKTYFVFCSGSGKPAKTSQQLKELNIKPKLTLHIKKSLLNTNEYFDKLKNLKNKLR